MTAQHTTGRAFLDAYEPIIRGEDGERIATCYRLFDGDRTKTPEETGMANARRLVACWNACEGLDTDKLERMPVPFAQMLNVGFMELWEQYTTLKEQRADLLEALKQIESRKYSNWSDREMRSIARAAIAKAGGAA